MKRLVKDCKCAPHRERHSEPNIAIRDCGRSVTLQNPSRAALWKTRIDGGIVKNQCAADYVVSKPRVGDLVIELKGKEVSRACEQVIATAEMLKNCTGERGRVAGLIICSRFPANDTKIQRLKAEFARRFKGILKIRTGASPECFDTFFP